MNKHTTRYERSPAKQAMIESFRTAASLASQSDLEAIRAETGCAAISITLEDSIVTVFHGNSNSILAREAVFSGFWDHLWSVLDSRKHVMSEEQVVENTKALHQLRSGVPGPVFLKLGLQGILSRMSPDEAARRLLSQPKLLEAVKAVRTEGRDANPNGDVVIPSHVWDLLGTAFAEAEGR